MIIKMKTVSILLFLCCAVANADINQSQRIVGGQLTTIDRYPSMCALLHSRNLAVFTQDCGGSILNSRSVLTAAHCLITGTAANTKVRVGSTWANSGGTVHASSLRIIHPNYNNPVIDSDIGIVRTASTISFNNNVQMARIAGPNYNVADNQVVWATGWGRLWSGGPTSEQLRHVQVWTINQAVCRQRFGSIITDNMLCIGWLDVGGRGQCSQDSGGPVYHNGVVIGVCSFGSTDCANPYYPHVNVRVSRYTSWIQANS